MAQTDEWPLDFTVGPSEHVGVLDIGSNSIRLVVFDGDGRMPIPLFNEKSLCGLGVGLASSGRLSDAGVVAAMETLDRFFAIARSMNVEQVHVLATAAVRDARNGPEFVTAVEKRYGYHVSVLSGDEEARLSALGVISSFTQADGVVGDLGGGSLELVDIHGDKTRRFTTLPLGPLRLGELTRQNRREILQQIDAAIGGVPWIHTLSGRNLYAVGGAWRSLARAHMEVSDYPLEVIHGYSIGREEACRFLDDITQMNRRDMRGMQGVSKRRVDKVPVTALVLKQLLEIGQAKQVVFSSFGLREGCLYDRLPKRDKARDPLLDSCMDIARKASRFSPHPDVLEEWLAPLFADVTQHDRRLIKAVCALCDIAWNEHPSYRGEHAFFRVLRLPVVGVSHADRVFLAYAILVRYAGEIVGEDAARVRKLLSMRRRDLAIKVGLALRLALTLTGGVTGLLEEVRIRRDRDMVGETGFVISLNSAYGRLGGEAIERRIAALQEALGTPIRVEG